MVQRFTLYYRIFIVIFWIETCFGFVAEELLPSLDALRNVTMLLCDIVTLILGCLVVRKLGDLLVIATYLALAVLSTLLLNGESLLTLFNGTRDFLGLLFAIPILRWFLTHERAPEFKEKWIKTLKVWLYLQAVCVTEQYIRYGAGDHGGGTMGLGASGMVSTMIYLVSFFIVTQNWDKDNYFGSLLKNWRYIVLLYPSFLNETKVSFIMLIAYFVLLIKFDRKLIIRMFIAIPLGIASFIGLGALYLNITNQDADKVLSDEFVEEYFYGIDLDHMIDVALMVQDGTIEIDPHELWSVDIPRFAKLVLIMPELRESGGGLAFGTGVGQFKGGSLVKETRFASYNHWLLLGSRPWTFFVITQIGFVGLLWWLFVMIYQTYTRRSKRPFAIQFQIMVSILYFVVLFYNDSPRIFNYLLMLNSMLMFIRYYTPEEEAAEEDEATDSDTIDAIPANI